MRRKYDTTQLKFNFLILYVVYSQNSIHALLCPANIGFILALDGNCQKP
jgi:hypothetical protein